MTAASPTTTALPFFFIADDVALDFVNTLAAPAGTLVDLVDSPERFMEWLSCVPALAAMKDLAVEAERDGALPVVLEEARRLRDWLVATLRRLKGEGAAAPGLDVAPLNRVLGAGSACWQLDERDGRLDMMLVRRYDGPLSVLVPLAEAIAELLTRVDPAFVRKCENPKCTLWFRDTTKRGHRRWCSPAACGNRAKVAAHRQRQREGHG